MIRYLTPVLVILFLVTCGPEPTPAVGELGTPAVGSHGKWELTVLSVEHHDTVYSTWGPGVVPNEGHRFLAAKVLMKSLGAAKTTALSADWFHLTDQEGHNYRALDDVYTRSSKPYTGSSKPLKKLDRTLAFEVPTSATHFRLKFTGPLDDFVPIYLGE